jgi:hypothetical protein
MLLWIIIPLVKRKKGTMKSLILQVVAVAEAVRAMEGAANQNLQNVINIINVMGNLEVAAQEVAEVEAVAAQEVAEAEVEAVAAQEAAVTTRAVEVLKKKVGTRKRNNGTLFFMSNIVMSSSIDRCFTSASVFLCFQSCTNSLSKHLKQFRIDETRIELLFIFTFNVVDTIKVLLLILVYFIKTR